MLNLSQIFHLGFFKKRSGLFWVGILLLGFAVIGITVIVTLVLTYGVNLGFLLGFLIFMASFFFGFRGLKNSISEKSSFFFAKKITLDILSYMGAERSFDMDAVSSRDAVGLCVFTDEVHKTRKEPFFRWLLLAPIGGNNRLHALLHYNSRDLCVLIKEFQHAEMYALHLIMKEERAAIQKLKREKLYNPSVFERGVPLATYILIATKYEDRVERALKMKALDLEVTKAYFVSNAAVSISDIDTLADLPIEWVIKAGGALPQ